MSIETFKAEVQSLSIDERRKLMAFLIALENEGSAVENHVDAGAAKKEEDYFPVRKTVGRRHS